MIENVAEVEVKVFGSEEGSGIYYADLGQFKGGGGLACRLGRKACFPYGHVGLFVGVLTCEFVAAEPWVVVTPLAVQATSLGGGTVAGAPLPV